MRFFTFLLLNVFCINTYCADFIAGGITYRVLSESGKTVEVIHNDTLKYFGAITIPANVSYGSKNYKVVSVGDGAFICCDNLESVVLPTNVYKISERAFYGCSSLTRVDLGNNTDSIGHYSFNGCKSLTEITIPENVLFIGRAAFRGCENLSQIHLLCSFPPTTMSSGAINSFDAFSFEHTVIIVPRGTVPAYRSSDSWNMFAHITDQTSGSGENLLSFLIEGTGHIFYEGNEVYSGSTTTITEGQQPIFIFKGDDDHHLSHVFINDEDYILTMSGDTLICPPIHGTTLLKAVFPTRDTYLTVCHNSNGSLQIDMAENRPVRIRIMPQSGWNIHKVFVDDNDMTSEVDADNYLTIPKTHSGMSIRIVLEKNGKYTVWTADGLMSQREITTPIRIPDDAVVADITGCTDMEIIPNSNPNTLYLTTIDDDLPETLRDKNIIVDGHSSLIRLYDGYETFIPYDFTADKAEYHRTPSYGSNGKGGWDTIVLPFKVESVINKDNNETIDWFHYTEDIGNDFWLRQYEGVDDANMLLFSNVAEWQPNVPYIIAVPDDSWGPFLDLRSKPLSFEANNTMLHCTNDLSSSFFPYTFHGTFMDFSPKQAYVMNDAGDAFERKTDEEVKAFRAYFTNENGNGAAKLPIGPSSDNVLSSAYVNGQSPKGTYNISGVKINDTKALPHGIYIIDGKKELK